MKAVLALLLLLAGSDVAYSQYYFNDVLTAKQTNLQYLLLKKNKIQEVTALSFEADGSPAEDFMLIQEISFNRNEIITTSQYPSTGRSVSSSIYSGDKIVKTVDSSDNIKRTTTYSYTGNNLEKIYTLTEDAFMNNALQEDHIWMYENDLPAKMLLIKNGTDTTVIEFIKDENSLIAEEHWKKNGTVTEKYFYYYSEQGLLSDIVRFNSKAQRLLPDFLFEYDNTGTLTQFIQIPEGSDNYLIWKYIYNTNGLKQKEVCFNKQKQPVGRIEYKYR